MKKIDIRNMLYLSFIALLINALFCIPLYGNWLSVGDDLIFHLSRIDGVLTAIQDHQFPLKIYPYKNYGFGYASPLFYCDLFMIFPALLYRLGLPLVISYKVLIFVLTYFSIFTVIYIFKYMSKSNYIAIFSATVWAFGSYHLVDVYSRSAVGEIFGFCFIPLLIFNIYQYVVEDKNNWIGIGIIFTMLLMSHNITFIMSCIFFGIVIILNLRQLLKKNKIITIVKAVLLSLGLSAFFLFPMLEQLSAQTYFSKMTVGDNLSRYVLTVRQFFLDLFYGENNQRFYYTSGLLTMALMPIIMIVKNKDNKYLFFFKLFLISLFLLLCTSVIMPFYKIELFEIIQFPWRLNLFVANIVPFIVCYSLTNMSKKMVQIISLFSLVYLLVNTSVYFSKIKSFDLNIKNNATYSEIFEEQKYMPYHEGAPYNVSELSGAEYLPYSYDFFYDKYSNKIMFPGKNEYKCYYERNGLKFIIYSDYDWNEQIMLPLSWYKGYVCKELNEKDEVIKDVNVYPSEYERLVSIDIENGNHIYKIYYEGTTVQKITLYISLATLLYLIIIITKKEKNENS